MKCKILIDPQTKTDLKEIYNFVYFNDSRQMADKLLNNLEAALYKLEKYPKRGHIPPELIDTGIKSYLEIHYKHYRIIYELEKNIFYIHSILDGRRNIQETLQRRILR